MDRSKIKNIKRDLIKRKNFLKNEIKIIIFKSIIRNLQINNIIRVHILKKISFLKKKNYISYQNNVCLLSGRIGGVFKQYGLSRHTIKVMAKFNMLNNTKIKSF